jgi:hypothetical protein
MSIDNRLKKLEALRKPATDKPLYDHANMTRAEIQGTLAKLFYEYADKYARDPQMLIDIKEMSLGEFQSKLESMNGEEFWEYIKLSEREASKYYSR